MGGFRPNPGMQNRYFQQLLREFGENTVSKDETISDITKQEILTEIGAQNESNLGNARAVSNRIQATFAAAQQGKGKFAGRQIQSKQRDLIRDRPGRAQTILTR